MLTQLEYLLFSDVTMKAGVDIVTCLIVWLAVYLFCRLGRLKNDIIENATEDAAKMLKAQKSLASQVAKKNMDRNNIRKVLNRIKFTAKNTKSILQVKVYEGGDDPDLTAAIKLLDSIQENIVQFALAYNTSDRIGLEVSLDDIKSNCEKTCEVLTEVKKRNDEYSLSRL